MSIRDHFCSPLVTKTVWVSCFSVALALSGCVLDGTYAEQDEEPIDVATYGIDQGDPDPGEGGRDEFEQSSAQASSSMELPGSAVLDPHPDPWRNNGKTKNPGGKD